MRVASFVPFVAALPTVAAQSQRPVEEPAPMGACANVSSSPPDGGRTWTESFDGYYSRL